MARLKDFFKKLGGIVKPWEIFVLIALASLFYGIHLISRPWAFIIGGLAGGALYCLHEISDLYKARRR